MALTDPDNISAWSGAMAVSVQAALSSLDSSEVE